MNVDINVIKNYFQKLGLLPEIADIYLSLHTHGPQTISDLARHSGVERTRIYRLIDELEKSNLVETQLDYKRRIFHAAPISNLQILISKKEQELEQLQQELDTINQAFTQPDLSSPTTRVQFYQGPDGAKQMFWNQTKAHTEVLSILHETMQHKTKRSFFERWVGAMNEREIAHRSIVDDAFIASLKKWRSRHPGSKTKIRQARKAPDSFAITIATVIYDDVVVYYNWQDNEVFGVEIHNGAIANTQRQFFEMLWQQSSALK
jgi:sugar-specific transcriptional regulator TrmB